MSYFTTRQTLLFTSFNLNLQDEEILYNFFKLLEDSGVGTVIEQYVKNETDKGGRPNVNYYNLFAAVIYAFSKSENSVRRIEELCQNDLRFLYIMGGISPDYSTISKFITNVIVPNELKIFTLITKAICNKMEISDDDAFIDGTKYEANANKYKFVWKPLTFHERLSKNFFKLIRENGVCTDFKDEKYVNPSTIGKAISALSANEEKLATKEGKDLMKALEGMLNKAIEYQEKEEICGENRNSYYKTDHDATAMALKTDYYSGLGSNMHAAYNVQILVSQGIVMSFYLSQSRTDLYDFIPILDRFYESYGHYPKNVCADSGYGSLDNYSYMQEHGINNYVKYFSWEGNASGSNPDCYKINDDMTEITCLNGKAGKMVEIEGRHPRKKGGKFFKIEGCKDCPFKAYCMRFTKDFENKTEKIFEVNPQLYWYKQQGEKNLLSPKGIELRVNRSVQVEGTFGICKQNQDYDRLRRRGLKRTSAEIMLIFLGMNIKKLLRYLRNGYKPKHWVAPSTLEEQTFKKPSAKRLSKKGKKINESTYKKDKKV